MSRHRSSSYLSCTFLLLHLVLYSQNLGTIQASDERDSIEKFKTEYNLAAPRLQERFAQLRGTCRISRQSSKNLDTIQIDEATFHIDHNISKVSIQRPRAVGETGDRSEIVYCIAPDYAFTIGRVPGEKSFEVLSLGADRSDFGRFTNNFGRYIFASFTILGHKSLFELMRSKGFEIVSASHVRPDHFEIEYRIGSSTSKDRVKLVFDPTKGWVITRGVITPALSDDTSNITFQVDYQSEGPIPLPKRVKYHDVTGLDTVCDFTLISAEPTDVKEFTMSYYGLPEMTGPGRSTNRTRISILVILAFLSAILGIFLRYRHKGSLADLA